MKTIRLLLLIAVTTLLFSCHEKKAEGVGVQPLAKQTTLQADGVMGKAKLIIEKKYMRIPTMDSVALYAIHYQYFNEDGWIVKDVITNDANDTIFTPTKATRSPRKSPTRTMRLEMCWKCRCKPPTSASSSTLTTAPSTDCQPASTNAGTTDGCSCTSRWTTTTVDNW